MAKRIGGSRRKTRHMSKKPVQRRGKISITKTLQELKPGQKVVLKMESGVQKGLYYRRYHGKTGVVEGKKGNAYLIKVKDGRLSKTVTVGAVHLKRLSQ